MIRKIHRLRALNFDGLDDLVTVTDAAPIQNTFDGGGTWEAWIFPRSAGGSNVGRIGDKRGGAAGPLFSLSAPLGNIVRLRFSEDFSTTDGLWSTADRVVTLNQWNHVAVVYNADSVTNDPAFYVNGVLGATTENTTPVGTRVSDATRNLLIGSNETLTATFDGPMSQARIWTVPRTQAEIQADMHRDISPDAPTSMALEFDGVDDLVTVTDQAGIQNIFDGGGTIECWIKPRSDGEGDSGRVYTKGGLIMATTLEAGGLVRMSIVFPFSTTNGTWNTEVNIPLLQWTHLALVFNSDSAANDPTLYVDGIPRTVGSGLTESVSPVGTRVSDAGNNLIIGNDPTTVRTFDGFIDEVRLWNDIRTEEEIQQNKDSHIPADSPGLVGYWKLNTGSGTTAVNSVSGGNNGTITGAQWAGLVALYRFNEGLGITAVDAVSANNGVITGAGWRNRRLSRASLGGSRHAFGGGQRGKKMFLPITG